MRCPFELGIVLPVQLTGVSHVNEPKPGLEEITCMENVKYVKDLKFLDHQKILLIMVEKPQNLMNPERVQFLGWSLLSNDRFQWLPSQACANCVEPMRMMTEDFLFAETHSALTSTITSAA